MCPSSTNVIAPHPAPHVRSILSNAGENRLLHSIDHVCKFSECCYTLPPTPCVSKAREIHLCANSTNVNMPPISPPHVLCMYVSFTLLTRWKTICCVASALCASSTGDTRMALDMAPQAPQEAPKDNIVKTEKNHPRNTTPTVSSNV